MKHIVLFYIITLLTIDLSGCKYLPGEPDERIQVVASLNETDAARNEHDIEAEIRECMDRFMDEYMSDHGLEIDKKLLMGESAEGGEITRYRDANGNVLRYRLIYYGEMARAEDNYYFVKDYIYYTRLVENYSSPIYVKETDVLNREFVETVWMDGSCETTKIPYSSLEELNGVFQMAEGDGSEPNFSDYNILALNGYLLGGYYNHQWRGWDELYPIMAAENDYKIYNNGQYKGIAPGRKVSETYEEIYSGPTIDFSGGPVQYDGYSKLAAYSGKGDIKIEQGVGISLENEVYRNELAKYVVKTGYTEAFELTNILKIDIDDDGQDEVFIQAYRKEDVNHEGVGIQYMRKVVNGDVQEIIIPLSQPLVDSDFITIEGFCDLNGDGVKELLVSSMGIGYHGYVVYEFKNHKFIGVLENGGDH